MGNIYTGFCQICGEPIDFNRGPRKHCDECKSVLRFDYYRTWRKKRKPRDSRIIPGRTMYSLAGLVRLPTEKFLNVVQRQIHGEDLIRGALR